MRRIWIALAIACASITRISAAPPDSSFVGFGRMYGEANQGQPAHHSHQTLAVTFRAGTKMIDTSYRIGSIACCGGEENENAGSTTIPSGVHIEVGGGSAGEWGVFNIKRTSITDDDTGELKGYELSADLYCGPSASRGGCNIHLDGWIKLKPKQ